MRNSILLAVGEAALLVAGTAYAGDTASGSGTDATEIICKSGPPPTGTRIGPTRVCKTKAQWDQERRDAQNTLVKVQTQRDLHPHGVGQ